MKESSGTLLYRKSDGGKGWEVLIVRPAGPSARYGWSLPKGSPEPGETEEATARRETEEETGCRANTLVYLGHIEYVKSRKRVHGFAGPAPADCAPRCASWEVDRAEFVALDEAKKLLHVDQSAFIERLAAVLG